LGPGLGSRDMTHGIGHYTIPKQDEAEIAGIFPFSFILALFLADRRGSLYASSFSTYHVDQQYSLRTLLLPYIPKRVPVHS
jgi:hypothetical protein